MGMSRPRRPAGYPVPSKRSWWYRTYGRAEVRAGKPLIMCAPITGCRWTLRYSVSLRRPGLHSTVCEMDVLPMSCRTAPSRTSSSCVSLQPSVRAIMSALRVVAGIRVVRAGRHHEGVHDCQGRGFQFRLLHLVVVEQRAEFLGVAFELRGVQAQFLQPGVLGGHLGCGRDRNVARGCSVVRGVMQDSFSTRSSAWRADSRHSRGRNGRYFGCQNLRFTVSSSCSSVWPRSVNSVATPSARACRITATAT